MVFVFLFLFSFVFVNGKVVVINTNSYESSIEPVIEKNVTRTIVFYESRRIKNYVYDQSWYDFTTDKRFDERMEEKMKDNLNYKDKTAEISDVYSIPRSGYSRYYECYDFDFDKYYKDYDYWNPCLD